MAAPRSAAPVLRDAALARVFDASTFDGTFFPPVWVHHSRHSCSVSVEAAMRACEAGAGLWCENLQEVSIIAFFNATYPFRLLQPPRQRSKEAKRLLAFLPICPWAENSDGNSTNYELARSRLNPPSRMAQGGEGFASTYLGAADAILERVSEERCFFVASHQVIQPHWSNRMRLCRALLMDKTFSGATQDVVIPYSAHLQREAAPTRENRSLLLMGSGKLKPFGMFQGVRKRLLGRLRNMGRPDVDARQMPYLEYLRRFYEAKFCLVLPGDSMSTQQSARAMLSGCVPVFVVNEERDLFAFSLLDYAQFSLVLHVHEALRHHGAQHLLHRLEKLVENGGYSKLKANLQIALEFVDFSRSGPRSPYALMLAQLTAQAELRDPNEARGGASSEAMDRRELAKLVGEATQAADEAEAQRVREQGEWAEEVHADAGNCGPANISRGKAPCSQWSKLRSGSWYGAAARGINGLRECAVWCRSCWRCNYVSYSRAADECSWYTTCPALQTAGRANAFLTYGPVPKGGAWKWTPLAQSAPARRESAQRARSDSSNKNELG